MVDGVKGGEQVSEYNVSTVFTADISNFQKSTQDMQKYIKLVNSEFKAAVGGSKDFEKSADGLKVKIEQLSRTMQAEEQILKNKEANLDKLKKKYGENSKEVQEYTVQVNNQKAKLIDIQRNIDKYAKALDDMGDEAKNGSKSLKDLDKATKDVSDGFTVAKGAIAGFIANGLTALIGSAKNAITNVLGLADATREYRQTLATLDTAADDAGVNADVMKDKFTDLMGVFNDQDSVTEGLNNLLASGFNEDNIDQITQQLEGAALKWKDTLKFEGLADGLQETLATGSAIGPFAEMLERSGVNLDKFDDGLAKATTDAEKQNYVLEELSKLGLTEVSESYRKQNAQMIEAQQANINYQNAVATMGETIEPITTKIREGFTRIVEKMIELVDGVDFEALAGKIDAAFTKFIDEIIPKIVDGLQWILDNKDSIIAGVAGIGAAFVAWKVTTIIQGVIKSFKAWKLATEGMTIAQRALNLVMKANPIGLVISLIAGLVTAFVILWNKSDAFRNFWINLWENVKNITKKAWTALTDGAKKAWEGIKSIFSKVGSFFSKTFSDAWSKVKSIFSTGGKIFSGIKDGIASAFKNIVNGLIGGINKVVATPFNAINKMLNKIRDVSILGAEPFKGFWSKNPISVPQIPKLAKGEIVDKETARIIGDAGKEAVIPLERNTQGLELIADKMVDKLNARGMSGATINYYNNFTNMPTTRYAMKKAMADSAGMYQLFKVLQGGA